MIHSYPTDHRFRVKTVAALVKLRPYFGSFAVAFAALMVAIPIDVLFDVPSMSRVFLVAVLISAISYGLWPSMFAAFISVVFYDFFFIPPVYSLVIHSVTDLVNLVFFIVTAVVVSGLAARVRRYAVLADKRALTAEKLSAFARRIGRSLTVEDVLTCSSKDIGEAMGTSVVTLLAEDGRLNRDSFKYGGAAADRDLFDRLERVWATRLDWPETFRLDAWHFHGLRCDENTSCLIGARVTWAANTLRAEQQQVLHAFGQQTASAIEQNRLRQRLADARVQTEAEEFGAALLNSVSHDLRGPLTTILGAMSSLDVQWMSLREDARIELIETARAETEHLSAYIDNLLDITRIAFGAIGPNLSPLSLADLVGAAARKARGALSEHRLMVDVPEELPMVEADGALLQQIIVNLLDNAAKYSPAGSLVRLVADSDDETVTLQVLDEGPGVPGNELTRIFDKFFRSSTTRTKPGTGLGLTICRGFIQAMHGTIEARNRTDRSGLCVRVTLPTACESRLPRVAILSGSSEA